MSKRAIQGPSEPPGDGPRDPQPPAPARSTVSTVARSIPRSVAETGLVCVQALLNGTLPLKHARAAHALLDVTLRGEIGHQEYEVRGPIQLPTPLLNGESTQAE